MISLALTSYCHHNRTIPFCSIGLSTDGRHLLGPAELRSCGARCSGRGDAADGGTTRLWRAAPRPSPCRHRSTRCLRPRPRPSRPPHRSLASHGALPPGVRRPAAQGRDEEADPRRGAARRRRLRGAHGLALVDGGPVPGDHRQRLPAGRQGDGVASHLGLRHSGGGRRQPARPRRRRHRHDRRPRRPHPGRGCPGGAGEGPRAARRLQGCRDPAGRHRGLRPGRHRQRRGRPRLLDPGSQALRRPPHLGRRHVAARPADRCRPAPAPGDARQGPGGPRCRAEAGPHLRGAGRQRRRRHRVGAGQARWGRAEPRLHDRAGAGRRRRGRPLGAGRPDGAGRHGAPDRRADGPRHLPRRQLQGDAARRHGGRPARGVHRGRLRRPRVPRHRRQLLARHGRAVRPAAARERHRQLHQGGAARAGEDPPRHGRPDARPPAAGPVGRGHRRDARRRAGRAAPSSAWPRHAERGASPCIQTPKGLAAPVARRRGGDPGRLHGHPGHPDHQFVAQRHRGRARRLLGRGELDLHRLPDGRDHRHPADGLARLDLRAAGATSPSTRACSSASRSPARCRRACRR